MENLYTISRAVGQNDYKYQFSICTLVTRKAEYSEMIQSFVDKGFDKTSCEYLHIDNTQGCTFEAFKGLNLFLQQAQGRYVILCHQDILLLKDDRAHLEARINEIELADKHWALLGNAGGLNLKYLALHITQGDGRNSIEKRLPLKTQSLDENFIIAKNAANLVLSNDLAGFHMYGADLCLIADVLGYKSYVIDFNLLHKSSGNADEAFYNIRQNFIDKYSKAFRDRYMSTTITKFFISGTSWKHFLFNLSFFKSFARRCHKIFRPKKGYHLIVKSYDKNRA